MAGPRPLVCRDVVEQVTEYLDGALPPPERTRFEGHLRTCGGCRHYLAQMRRTVELVGRLPAEDVSPAARQELLALFRNWKAG